MVAPSLTSNLALKVIVLLLAYICKNFLITDSKFRCTVIGKTYFIKGNLSCDSCIW